MVVPRIEQLFYDDIKTHQVKLTNKQQQLIVRFIELAKERYVQLLLEIDEAREFILSYWRDKINMVAPNYIGLSTAKMAEDYNSNKRGLNKSISNRVNKFLYQASSSQSREKQIQNILQAGLHARIYFLPELQEIGKQNRRIVSLLKGIERRRQRLLFSVLQLSARIAKNRIENLSGDVITYNDLLQEGIIAAYEATLYGFDPSRNAKWSSYVWDKVDKVVSKYVAEKTRTVRIPRYVLSRHRIIKANMDDLPENIDIYDLVDIINNNIKGNEKKFSVSEVDYLNNIMDATNISITLPPAENSVLENHPEFYTEDTEGDEPLYDKILKQLHNLLPIREAIVLRLRWGLTEDGKPLALDQAIVEYTNITGNKINKEKLKDMEDRALKRLKDSDSPELRELWETSEQLIQED